MRTRSRFSWLVITLLLPRCSLASAGARGVAGTRVPVDSSGTLELTSSTQLHVSWTPPDRVHRVGVLHTGGVRYRLYHRNPSHTEGRGTSNVPFLGPKVLLYGDGAIMPIAAAAVLRNP